MTWRDNAVAVAHALGHFLVSDDVACTAPSTIAKQSHQKNVMVIYVLTTKYVQLTYF